MNSIYTIDGRQREVLSSEVTVLFENGAYYEAVVKMMVGSALEDGGLDRLSDAIDNTYFRNESVKIKAAVRVALRVYMIVNHPDKVNADTLTEEIVGIVKEAR